MAGQTLYDKVWARTSSRTTTMEPRSSTSTVTCAGGLEPPGLRGLDSRTARCAGPMPISPSPTTLFRRGFGSTPFARWSRRPTGLAPARQRRRVRDSLHPDGRHRHGIVHVIGPELGFTLPGCTLVCGDSHTCTHGAFGAMAFGIGSSECECIFATQTLRQRKQKRMRITLGGALRAGVTVKDIILALIAEIGVSGGVGYALGSAGPTIAFLSMEARMTLCNMSIEAGSHVCMIAPDGHARLSQRPPARAGFRAMGCGGGALAIAAQRRRRGVRPRDRLRRSEPWRGSRGARRRKRICRSPRPCTAVGGPIIASSAKAAMSPLGQTRKYSTRANDFRCSPNNGHHQDTSACPFGANNGSRQVGGGRCVD